MCCYHSVYHKNLCNKFLYYIHCSQYKVTFGQCTVNGTLIKQGHNSLSTLGHQSSAIIIVNSIYLTQSSPCVYLSNYLKALGFPHVLFLEASSASRRSSTLIGFLSWQTLNVYLIIKYLGGSTTINLTGQGLVISGLFNYSTRWIGRKKFIWWILIFYWDV